MHYMQFRIHPSVGFARMGDSPDAYYLASDFPRFLQEAYPELRLRPRPRAMPQDDAGQPSPAPGPFQVFDDQKPPASQKAINDRFKDKAAKILPQAARFRVFAYCYASKDAEIPTRVFEVTTDHAEIEWKVRLANHKAQTSQDVHVVQNSAPAAVKTDTAKLLRLPVTPDPIGSMAARPPLAYLFLERNAADKTKVNGRLHLISNAGEISYFGAPGEELNEGLPDLWYDNWFDSEADGPVEASDPAQGRRRASEGGGLLRHRRTRVPQLRHSGARARRYRRGQCTARLGGRRPAGIQPRHRALRLALGPRVQQRPAHGRRHHAEERRHRTTRWSVRKLDTERFRCMDYRIHIHPQLCSFRDVNWISGATSQDPGHHTTTPSGPAPTGAAEETIIGQLQRGGVRIDPRDPAEFAKLADPAMLKDPDAGKPLADWLKIAFYRRLRMPGNLYNTKRKFFEGTDQVERIFPRRLGRRGPIRLTRPRRTPPRSTSPVLDDTKLAGTKPAAGALDDIPGNVRFYSTDVIERRPDAAARTVRHRLGPPYAIHGLSTTPAQPSDGHVFDRSTPADMPLLRELACTHLQFSHSEIWKSATPDPREKDIFGVIVSPQMDAAFKTSAGHRGAFRHYARPKGEVRARPDRHSEPRQRDRRLRSCPESRSGWRAGACRTGRSTTAAPNTSRTCASRNRPARPPIGSISPAS